MVFFNFSQIWKIDILYYVWSLYSLYIILELYNPRLPNNSGTKRAKNRYREWPLNHLQMYIHYHVKLVK